MHYPGSYKTMEPTKAVSPEAIILRVAAGTVNPAKIRAVDQAFRRAAARNNGTTVHFEISGFDVDSNVPDQPIGDKETLLGAKNRAKAAYLAYRNAYQRFPHLAVGMEGGLEWLDVDMNDYEEEDGANDKVNPKLYCMAWMAIYGRREAMTVDLMATAEIASYSADNKPVFGLAKTAMFPIPDEVAALVKQGIELGEADDIVFKRVKSKHGNGLVGLLTGGVVDRSEYYEQALVLALTPWMRSDLYPLGN